MAATASESVVPPAVGKLEFLPFDILTLSKQHDSKLDPEILRVVQISDKYKIDKIGWKDIAWPPKGRPYTEARYNGQRDVVPPGYIRYIAIGYARSHARLIRGERLGVLLGAANAGGSDRDVLSIYRNELKAHQISLSTPSDRLLATYGLLIAKGKLESDGRFYKGQDANRPSNQTAAKAESGAFQSSYDIIGTNKAIKEGLNILIPEYAKNPIRGHLYIAASGTPNGEKKYLEFPFHGSGEGRRFQELSRLCPAFSAESSALALRYSANNYAAVLTQLMQIEPKCFTMLAEIRELVEATRDHKIFLVNE